ncbi:MAG TPA: cytochrome c maturation protein CcmE [Solimonas sp.]
MNKRQKRMVAVASLLVGLALASVLGFTAFRKNMMYFYTPTDLATQAVPVGAKLRLGGLVETGSVKRGDGLQVNFTLADCDKTVAVRYDGILPDLFREGQGIVATGSVDDGGTFVADEVLAKHDENYMPPELAESLVSADGKHSCMPFKPVNKPAAVSASLS